MVLLKIDRQQSLYSANYAKSKPVIPQTPDLIFNYTHDTVSEITGIALLLVTMNNLVWYIHNRRMLTICNLSIINFYTMAKCV